MVFKVCFLSSWPSWTSRLWYNQLSNRSNFLSPERWKGEFSPPAKILSLSWTSSDILRDNCLVLWSWNMNFLTQWSVLSKMTSPIMQSVPNAILWVLNKNNVHKSESILQNPILFRQNCIIQHKKCKVSIYLLWTFICNSKLTIESPISARMM